MLNKSTFSACLLFIFSSFIEVLAVSPEIIDSTFIFIFEFFCIYKLSISSTSEDTSEFSPLFGLKILFAISNKNRSLSILNKGSLISSFGYESDNSSERYRPKILYKN